MDGKTIISQNKLKKKKKGKLLINWAGKVDVIAARPERNFHLGFLCQNRFGSFGLYNWSTG